MWKKQQTSSGVVLLDVLLGAVLIVAADVNDLTLGLDRLGLHLGGLLFGVLLGLGLHLGLHPGLVLLPGLLRPDSLEGTLHPVKRRMADELGVLPVVSGRLTPDDAVVVDLDHNAATPSLLSLQIASNERDVQKNIAC